MHGPFQLVIEPQELEATDLGRVLLAGRAVVTVRSALTDQHITVQAKCSAKVAGRWRLMPYALASHVFFDVPGSGDSDSYNDKVGTLYPPHSESVQRGKFWPDHAADPARVWVARLLLDVARGLAPMASDERHYELLTSKFCMRCGAELREAESIERGLGPDCAKLVGAYVSPQYGTRHQVKVKQPPAPAPTAPDLDFGVPSNLTTIRADGPLREVFGR